MNRYFPVFLDLTGRNALVVGGGTIASRKARSLTEHGARVTVVAPRVKPEVARLASRKKIRLELRKYRPEDLKGRDLVFCSTDDEGLNASIGRECVRRKILVNVADRRRYCSFIMPATARLGEVTFAISTGGASPALAKYLAGEVRKLFGAKIVSVAEELKKRRARLLRLPIKKRREWIKNFLQKELK